MRKILFVCHGNICRSPMAEFVMRDLAARAGFPLEVASAATSTEELDNSVYPPVAKLLRERGLEPEGKKARQLKVHDYEYYDLLLGMDNANLRNMQVLFGGDPAGKLLRLLDLTPRPGEVADPWYTRDFESTWRDVSEGCGALLARLQEESP